MAEKVQHENWRELAEFAKAVYDEFQKPTGAIKDALGVKARAPEAFQQFVVEVKEYGFGISNMTAKDWFNNDFSMRQDWADQIAAVYEAYKAAAIEEAKADESKNALEAEIKRMGEELKGALDKVDALTEQLSKEEADKEAKAKAAKAAGADEEDTEPVDNPEEDAAEGEPGASKKG